MWYVIVILLMIMIIGIVYNSWVCRDGQEHFFVVENYNFHNRFKDGLCIRCVKCGQIRRYTGVTK